MNEENNEVRVVSATGGVKGQKPVRLHAIPRESLWELGRVYAFGEEKYDDYNFRKGYSWSLSYDALLRHVTAFWDGEDRDLESNLHHLAHAVWHGICLLFFSLTGVGEDDRPKQLRRIQSTTGRTLLTWLFMSNHSNNASSQWETKRRGSTKL